MSAHERERDVREVTVVIVHYRTPDLLDRCLESLAPYRARGVEVLVVDNASSELAPRGLEALDGVTLLAQGKNLGYSKAVNLGLARTRGRYCVVLNPDIVVEPGSLEALLETAAAHPEAGIVAPMLKNPDGSLQHSCRRFYDFETFLYRRTPLGRLRPNAKALRDHLMLDYDHAETRVVDWVLGGAMIVRMQAVEEVGGMDERFFLYFEDVDWCYQMHRRGWRVIYEPGAVMIHDHRRESARRPLGRSFFAHLSSVLRFYEKWSLVLYILKSKRSEIGRALRLVLDLVAVNAAFLVAYAIRMALGEILEKPVFDFSSYRNFWRFGNALTIGTFYVLGLYRPEPRGWDWVDRLFAIFRATGIVTVIMMATTFLLYTQSYSRAMVTLFWPLATATVLAGRQLVVWIASSVRDRRIDLPRIAVVGTQTTVNEVRRDMARRARLHFEPVYLPDFTLRHGGADAQDPALDERFLDFVRTERVESVYFVSPSEDGARIGALAPRLGVMGVRVLIRPPFGAVLSPDARVVSLAGSWAISLGSGPRWRVRGVLKRGSDLGLATLLMLLGAPVNGAFALYRYVTGKRPVTTVEERFVHPGTPIRHRMYHPRPRGNLFQIVCLDHYPRLFAVLFGRASFVGVYPFRREELDAIPPALLRVSLDAPVGLTGLWWFQRGTGLTPERLRALDVEYVQKWSNAFDFKTFIRALVSLVRTRGRLPNRPTSEAVSRDEGFVPMSGERP